MVASYPKISHHLPKTMNKRETQTCTDNALPASCGLGDAPASTGPQGRQELVSPAGSHCTSDHQQRRRMQRAGLRSQNHQQKGGAHPMCPPKTGPGAQGTDLGGGGLRAGDGGGPKTSSASGHRTPLSNPNKRHLPSRAGFVTLSEEGAIRL